MKKKTVISPDDYMFMEQNPHGDAGFDPEHNKRVIAETIKRGKLWYQKQGREYEQKTKERTEAVAAYLKNITQGNGVNDINKYFGRREIARLRANEVVNQLKANPELVQKLKDRYKDKGKLMSL